jgi:hypothetical protein
LASIGAGAGLVQPAPFRRDPFAWTLAGLCLLWLALLAPRLVYPDLNLDYPFVDGDSHDWIHQGLFLAGYDLQDSGRAPLLPLAIALLDRLGALSWLPLALQVVFLATLLVFYSLAARMAPRRAAFAAALALGASHSLQGISFQIMADLPASCLLFLGGRAFVLAGEEPRRYLTSGLWGGLSALTQPVGWLAAVPAALVVLARRRRDLTSRRLGAGVVLFLGLPGFWVVLHLAAFGSLEGNAARQWDLLAPHADSIPFYLFAAASLLGLPGSVLLVFGLGLAARRSREDDGRLFWLALFATVLAFFVFFYDFNAKRFLVYLVWPAGLFLAEALGRLRRGALFGAAASLLVAGSALPLPGEGHDPSWIGLWPLPPAYLHAPLGAGRPLSGSPRVDLTGATVRAFPSSDLFGFFNNPQRVRNARQAWEATLPRERLDPTEVAADHSALFLYEQPSDGGGRYLAMTRLGNALRKKVKFVPAFHLEPWWPRIGLSPVGRIGSDYAVFRARLPGLDGSWLIAAPADGPLRRRLEGMGERPPGPPGPRLRRGLAKAEEIRRHVQGSSVMILPHPRQDLSQLYLPFLLETTALYFPVPGQEEETRALFLSAPSHGETRIGDTEVRKGWVLGRRAALVAPAGDGPTGTP